MSLNPEIFRNNLEKLKVRINGRCNNPKYRKLDVNPKNVESLLSLDNELKVIGCAPNTRATYFVAVMDFLEFVSQKPLEEVTREDVLNYFKQLKERGVKESSIYTFNTRILRFLLWRNGGEEYPECIKGLKHKKDRKTKLPKNLPTNEEIKRMIEVASDPRDKAIVSVLYESACRVGEFLNIKIGDLQPTEFGFKLVVSGKTGDRTILLVNSAPYLRIWLNHHPNKLDSESSLWVDIYKTRSWNYGKPLKYNGVYGLLKRLSKLASIEKNIHPHIFRHARLTEVARKVPESVLRKIAGWREDSIMVRTYVHLNNKDVEDVLLSRVYGREIKEEGEISVEFKPIICNRCKSENPNEANFCYNCYYPLNQEAWGDLEIVKDLVSQVLMGLLAKPDAKKELPTVIKQLKSKIGVSN